MGDPANHPEGPSWGCRSGDKRQDSGPGAVARLNPEGGVHPRSQAEDGVLPRKLQTEGPPRRVSKDCVGGPGYRLSCPSSLPCPAQACRAKTHAQQRGPGRGT